MATETRKGSKSKQVSITNVGPIGRIDIPIPESGVVVFRGNNGAGKSTAINAVDALVTGNTKSLSLRDGSLKGTVEGFGVTINVSNKRCNKSGSLEVEGIEQRIDLVGLIDPGILDHVAADKARIKALASLSGVAPTRQLFEGLGLDPHELNELLNRVPLSGRDIVEAARDIKRQLENWAREREEAALTANGRAESARLRAEGADLTVEKDAGKVKAVVAETQRDFVTAANRRAFGLEQARKFERAKEDLARVDLETGWSADDAAKAWKKVQEGAASLAEADNEIESLCRTLDAMKLARGRIAGEHADANAEFKRIQTRDDARARLAAAVESFKAEDFPSETDVAELDRKARQAVEAVSAAERAREAEAAIKEAREQREAAEFHADEGRRLRAVAKRTDAIVSESINAPGLRVEDGRLVTDTKRGATFFGNLSAGERTRHALNLGVARVGRGGLLALPQEFWEGLDGTARAEIVGHAKEFGVVVLTAEASETVGDNPITAQVYGAA
ncbi:AAA family ATPase [Zavarzinella formosa]|uniref:AAA family ATPase n=1 Tax=Zavarzinella formosa TaxID=360055 RepID=UPI0002E6CE80|nr:AAA family ATPase [Zavarzinella formosa]